MEKKKTVFFVFGHMWCNNSNHIVAWKALSKTQMSQKAANKQCEPQINSMIVFFLLNNIISVSTVDNHWLKNIHEKADNLSSSFPNYQNPVFYFYFIQSFKILCIKWHKIGNCMSSIGFPIFTAQRPLYTNVFCAYHEGSCERILP